MNLRGRNKVDPTFNMSSMTDIVFLLLIFFMLTSTLVTINAIDLILPNSSGKTENKATIAVSVTKKGDFYINKTKIDERFLESEILKSVGVDKDKNIVIRGDKKVDYEKVVKIIDIAQRNKLKMVLAVKVNN
ncbi:MAG: ExbD/TolR family protein [Polaribacter sp.]